MRALVLETQVPFVPRAAEISDLAAALRRAGHETDIVSIPFRADTAEQLMQHAAAWRLVNLTVASSRPIDLVIATAFPTYLVEHPRKVAWLLPSHRSAEDLCGSFSGRADAARCDGLITMDRQSLSECARTFVASTHCAARSSYDAVVADLIAAARPPYVAV